MDVQKYPPEGWGQRWKMLLPSSMLANSSDPPRSAAGKPDTQTNIVNYSKEIFEPIQTKYLIIPPGQRTRWWPFSVHFQSGCQWTGDSPRPLRSKQCQEFPEFIFSTLSWCNCIPLWVGVIVSLFELVYLYFRLSWYRTLQCTGAYLPFICFPFQVSYICLYISFYSALFTIIYIIYNSFSFLQNCKLTLCEARMTNSLASWK